MLHALRRPIDEVRMAAIVALGRRGHPHTAAALAECGFRLPTMMTQNLEIMAALDRFPVGVERDIALQHLTRYPSRPRAGTAAAALVRSDYRQGESEA